VAVRLILLLILALMLPAGPALAQEPELVLRKVAVLPFPVLAKEPMDALGVRIRQDFQERLEAEGFTLAPAAEVDQEVARLKEPIDDPQARDIGHKLGADVVIWGRLIVVADLLSLEARLLDLTGRVPPAALKTEGTGLPALGGMSRQLAQEASLRILGKERIVRIEVQGNRRIDKDAIIGTMQTREGEIISPARLREDLKAVYGMGFFTDVKFEMRDTPEGPVLIAVVQEKPAIREIRIQGNDRIKDKAILEVLDLKPYAVASESAIRENIDKILKLYTDKGFSEARVDYNLQPVTDTEVDLTFNVDEGGKVFVREIRFEGNQAFSDKRLRSVMETKERGLLSRITGTGKLDRDILERDVERVTAFYFNHGYVRAKVGEPRIDIRDRRIFITIPVEEGPQYQVGRVDLQGDLMEDKAKLLEILRIPKTKVYSREVVQEDLTTLADLYADQGYANADITPLIREDDAAMTVDITFDIRQGKQVYFERIEVEGNIKTRDKVIRRELRVYESELFSATKIKESIRNLRRLEYFEDVNFSTTPGTAPDMINLKVSVKERPTGTFGIGAGYSTQDRLVGMVEISQTNLFGRGQQLRLQGIIGAISNRFRLSFLEPYLFDRPLSLGFDAYNWEREFDEYTRKSRGGSVRLSHPLRWKYTRIYGSYRFENVDLSDLRPTASQVLREAAEIHNTSAVSFSIRRDSRDALFMPTQGSDNSLALEMAGLGGDTAFFRAVAESGWYFPLWWGTVAVAHGRVGYLSRLDWGALPAYEKFYLGGIDSLRGFNFAEITPRDPVTNERIGGDSFSQLNLEYRWPVPLLKKYGFMGTVFFDAGNVYGSNYVGPFLRTSVGGGVRWFSPMGPLRIEWGLNLSPKDYERKSVWEFTVGGTF
jgi:outer membrane protein insertion porin family